MAGSRSLKNYKQTLGVKNASAVDFQLWQELDQMGLSRSTLLWPWDLRTSDFNSESCWHFPKYPVNSVNASSIHAHGDLACSVRGPYLVGYLFHQLEPSDLLVRDVCNSISLKSRGLYLKPHPTPDGKPIKHPKCATTNVLTLGVPWKVKMIQLETLVQILSCNLMLL